MHHFLKYASKFCLNYLTFNNTVFHKYYTIHHISTTMFNLETKRPGSTNFRPSWHHIASLSLSNQGRWLFSGQLILTSSTEVLSDLPFAYRAYESAFRTAAELLRAVAAAYPYPLSSVPGLYLYHANIISTSSKSDKRLSNGELTLQVRGSIREGWWWPDPGCGKCRSRQEGKSSRCHSWRSRSAMARYRPGHWSRSCSCCKLRFALKGHRYTD